MARSSVETTVLLAPAKLNLSLYLGPLTASGLHAITSIFQPIDLCDRVSFTESSEDEVICEGIDGRDLTALTLEKLRQAQLDLPPLRVEVEKEIPVAAGMGGGSADAAALLRFARDSLGEEAVPVLRDTALAVGSDVLAQSGLWGPANGHPEASRALVTGTGDEVSAAPPGDPFAAVLLTSESGLSTPEVYAEADRLGSGRSAPELQGVAESLRFGSSGLPLVPVEAMVNDLQAAAIALRPDLEAKRVALVEAGATCALVTGSGPTVFGAFPTRSEAQQAADALDPVISDGIVVVEPLARDALTEAGE